MNKDYSILVVDDSIDHLKTIVEILRAAGFMVDSADNGKKAIEKCSTITFDLFIIDVMMPEIDGLDLLRRLNVLDNASEAIMMSGAENLEDARKAMELGAFGYIGKPAQSEELLMQVNKALRMVDVKKLRLSRLALLEKKVTQRSDELESMVRLLEYQGRQLDAIINSMGEGIIAIDNQKSIVLMNRQAEQITGMRFADCAGLHISKAFQHRAFADQLASLIEKASTPGKDINLFPVFQEDRSKRYYNVNVQEVMDDKGARTGSVVLFLDLTDAMNAGRMRDSFLSIAAHELRTPININMNYLALVQHQWENVEVRSEAVRGMQLSNHRLMDLVNRIISLANLSNHTYSLCRTPTDIGRLVALKIRKIQPEADEKKVKIVIDNRLADSSLLVDPYLLRIALYNLLTNAVKFNRIGGTVQIVIEQKPATPGKELTITVIDEGEGISERARSCLFESFVQGEDPLTRTQGGLGMGLYLVKKTAEFLCGSIEAVSEKGKGSTFTLKVPLP
jgi:two-component system, OmpR family, phosphate regulon sensor histidine kinase PhoR